MANLIQIKRSIANSVVTGLSPGELAFTANGNILYIGNPTGGASVRIAGLQSPGTLTANQALVANSTSAIDKVIVANLVPTAIYADGSFGSANQVLRTDGTKVYWSNDAGDISAVVAGDGLTGGGTVGELTINVGQGNGITVTADAISVNSGSTVTVNTSGVHVNTNLSITSLTTSGDVSVNGNTKLGDSASDVVSFNAEVNTSIIPSANITYNLGGINDRWATVYSQNVHSGTGYFDGFVQIAGDLVVIGNVTTTNVSSVIVSDPMIYLAGNNYTSDLLDIGFAANYFDGSTQRHTGLFRDASDEGVWKLFKGSEQELSGNNVVNTAAAGYTTASLQTYLLSGGLVTNATHVAITANATVNVAIVANTLTLSSPLVGTSGGTGLNTYTLEDILVANSTNGFRKLSLGTDGYVLQSNGSALVYNSLDGGTF
ncbi:MAG: hypothetical protein [Caudoviricetes sp.]|nr:MAG: hypothetical protein [Caudoviricetes sp.]